MQSVLNAIFLVLLAAFAAAFMLQIRSVARLTGIAQPGGRLLKLGWSVMLLGSALWINRLDITGVAETLDASAIIQIASAAVTLAICLFSFLQGGKVLSAGLLPAVLLMLYGFLGISTAGYSPQPFFSIYKAGLVMIDAMLVIALASYLPRNNDGRTILELTYFILTLYVVGAAVSAVLWPSEAYRQLGGALGLILKGMLPYMNANELGYLSAVAAILAIRRMFRGEGGYPRLYYMATFALSAVMLVVSQARTALIAFVVVLVFYAFVIPGIRKFLVPVLLAFAIAVVGFGVVSMTKIEDVTVEYARRGATDQQLESLSGRTGLWDLGWRMIKDAPIIGHGYEAGVKFGGPKYGIPPGMHMHNAHMQVLVNSGVLGYLLWISMVMVVAVRVYRRYRRSKRDNAAEHGYNAELLAMVMVILIKTLTGSMLVFHQNSLMLYMAIMIILAREANASTVRVGPVENDSASTEPDIAPKRPGRILQYKKR